MPGELAIIENIKDRIYTIRGVQVMLDKDLAELYGVETRTLKQATKRNIKRFPEDFMFVLKEDEVSSMVSQNVIPSKQVLGGALPFAFTEQGVAMLSGIINNDIAIDMNIAIMRAFVSMRHFLKANAQLFRHLDSLETRILKNERNMEYVLKALEAKNETPDQGIFFEGQMFDAYKFVSDIFRSAKKEIIIIDNYIDDSVLTRLSKKRKGVSVKIFTRNVTPELLLDAKKFNQQYPEIEIIKFNHSHDRFIIIDSTEIYHFGASLKDLGKKIFAFSKMDKGALELLFRLNEKDSRHSINPNWFGLCGSHSVTVTAIVNGSAGLGSKAELSELSTLGPNNQYIYLYHLI